jgi:hypothetical protein
LLDAGDEQPADTATPTLAGDYTTWERRSSNDHAMTGKDPPMEEEGAPAVVAAELGGVSPMTMDSGGQTTLTLGSRHRRHKLQKPPVPSARSD